MTAQQEQTGQAASPDGWRFWIDRGGTFTDILSRAPCGALATHKLLSQTPDGADATLPAIRAIVAAAGAHQRIAEVRLGTTIATNTLLERTGARTVLVTAPGLADVLEIGHQARPDIFALDIQRPSLLHERTIEIAGRIDAGGAEIAPLAQDEAGTALRQALADGFEACAIALPHAYLNPAHEAALAGLARRLGFAQVSASHEVSGLIGLIARGSTAVVEAYVGAALHAYVATVAAALDDGRLLCMKSDGGLVAAARFRGKDALLSGPAGGMVAAVRTAAAEGFDRVIGFDMGGTSTDVCHYAGAFERRDQTEISRVVLHVPMLDVHTIAAGGGSIVRFDGLRLRVGPHSAGARPGPASYGRGGPLTVTDCNVLLGRLQPRWFPQIFGPDHDQPLERAVVVDRFAGLAAAMTAATGTPWTPEAVAQGALDIAIDAMAKAIRKLTIERGFEVEDHVINCFGGAAGQHVCRVADALGVEAVLMHPYAGILSAYGMALADITARRAATLEVPLDTAGLALARQRAAALAEDLRDALAQDLRDALAQDLRDAPASSRGDGAIAIHATALLRFRGTQNAHAVPLGAIDDMAGAFEARYRQAFGFLPRGGTIDIAAISVEATLAGAQTFNGGQRPVARAGDDQPMRAAQAAARGRAAAGAPARADVHVDGRWQSVAVIEREGLAAGDAVEGPALIVDPLSTLVLDTGWQATPGRSGALLLRRIRAQAAPRNRDATADPVRIELFNALFMTIAEQMGQALRSTAQSTNIKERLDYSCAIFDRDAQLIANAPHMPVHLGSMGASVAVVRALGAALRPGDVFMLNDPYHGGTHLPDVTVVTPLFREGETSACAFLASRAHHADIGGITPGSMPADSRTIDEEGVLIPLVRIVDAAQGFDVDTITRLLGSARYPARNIAQNLADLRAQVAANALGAAELTNAMAHFGPEVVQAFMGHVLDHAEQLMRRALRRLASGTCTVEMDDGAQIVVQVAVDPVAGSATIDFTGTSGQRPGNFNAPRSVTRAAVLYVFRTLIAEDVPLNDGVARPLTLRVPEGTMLSPVYPAAVVAGNVEVSQAVVDALYGALGVLANSQGTMNNFTFGNAAHQYYETICGGVGAGPGHDGASAIHSHMTNSRLTDPEVLERSFPVRLEQFAIRRGSGGAGATRGGDGVVRVLRFLEPMTLSLLSSRRRIPPRGLQGGGDGACGAARLLRRTGETIALGGCASAAVEPGDRIVIETPGGGGFGQPATGFGLGRG